MTYIMYGQATFPNQTRRNRAVNTIRNAATSRGLTGRAWNGYVAGCQPVATTGITICYTTEDYAIVEQVEIAVQKVLQDEQYTGDFGWQDMGMEQGQKR